jgi:hypothetical protein
MEMQTALRFDHGASVDSVLKVAGVDNWANEAIEAHKAHELAKAPLPNSILRWQRQIQDFLMFTANATLFSILASFVASIGLVMSSLLGVSLMWAVYAFGVCLGSIAVYFLIAAVMDIELRGEATWVKCLPSDNMPDRARQIMKDVRAMFPNCSFVVHELRQNSVALDPILEAQFHVGNNVTESRFVLVWDKEGNIVPPPA